MSRKNPTAKLSKSQDDPDGAALLADDADAIRQKVVGAVTDSGREVDFDRIERLGIVNCLEIAAGLLGGSRERWMERPRTGDYGVFLRVVVEKTRALRARAQALQDDPSPLVAILSGDQEEVCARNTPQVRTLEAKMGTPLGD